MALFNDKVVVNLTNHDSSSWSKEQRDTALLLGGNMIVDLPFPNIPSSFDEVEVELLAQTAIASIKPLNPAAVIVQGEFTYVYAVVSELIKLGVPCYAACSERASKEEVQPDGSVKKSSIFKFVRFRRYM